jgi:hypothetical protein
MNVIDQVDDIPNESMGLSNNMFAAQPSAPLPSLYAFVRGRSVRFRDLEEKFRALADEWELYNRGKSVISYGHPAYFQIMTMGWTAVPFLLRKVAAGAGTWYPALQFIVGRPAERAEDRGNPEAVRQAWLRWGKLNEFWSESEQAPEDD